MHIVMLFSATAARAFILPWLPGRTSCGNSTQTFWKLSLSNALLTFNMRFAVSLPGTQMLDAAKELSAREDEGPETFTGERPVDRTLFILLSLAGVTVSSLLFGWYRDSLSQLPY